MSADAIRSEFHSVVPANQPVAHELSPGKRKGTVRTPVSHRDRSASFRSPEHDVNVKELPSEWRAANLFGSSGNIPAVLNERRCMVCEVPGIVRLHRCIYLNLGPMGQFERIHNFLLSFRP